MFHYRTRHYLLIYRTLLHTARIGDITFYLLFVNTVVYSFALQRAVLPFQYINLLYILLFLNPRKYYYSTISLLQMPGCLTAPFGSIAGSWISRGGWLQTFLPSFCFPYQVSHFEVKNFKHPTKRRKRATKIFGSKVGL